MMLQFLFYADNPFIGQWTPKTNPSIEPLGVSGL